MNKILVADYFDSLVYCNFGTNSFLDVELSLSTLKGELVPFFEDNNELVIVTGLNTHSLDIFLNNWLKPTLKTFKLYQDKIKIFLRDEKNEYDRSKLEEKDIQVIKNKSDVFDLINLKDKKIYAIGDYISDIDMLIKNVKLGGISGLINYDIDTNIKYHESNILYNYAFSKAVLFGNIEIYLYEKNNNKPIGTEELDKLEIEKATYQYNEFERIKKVYNNNQVTIDKLYKDTLIYEQIADYYQYSKSNYKPISDIKDIDLILPSLSMYSSFREFNKKVLSK